MKIKTVSLTKSFGNYENISMCAEVEENETHEECLEKLENEINAAIEKKQGYRTIRETVAELHCQKGQLERDIERLKENATKVREWFKNNNLKNIENDLPF